MLFPRRSWLWLYIRVGVLLGHEPSNPEPPGKNSCYRLHRLLCSFEEAETYCRGSQGGRLAHTWNPALQTFFQSSLTNEIVWWVGENLMLPRKRQETSHPGRALVLNVEERNILCLVLGRKKVTLLFQLLYSEKKKMRTGASSLSAGVHFHAPAFFCLWRKAAGFLSEPI